MWIQSLKVILGVVQGWGDYRTKVINYNYLNLCYDNVCIYLALLDLWTKVNMLFLDATIPVFDELNLLLQRDELCIHILCPKIVNILLELYIKFVKPDVIKSARTCIFCFIRRRRKSETFGKPPHWVWYKGVY